MVGVGKCDMEYRIQRKYTDSPRCMLAGSHYQKPHCCTKKPPNENGIGMKDGF